MAARNEADLAMPQANSALARIILFSFLVTFVLARIVVFLTTSHRLPDLYLHLGGTQIHHLDYGIFLLAGGGGYHLDTRTTAVVPLPAW